VNRADAAAYLGDRFAAYLTASNRTSADAVGGVKGPIDDALTMLGYAAAELPTADPGDEGAEDFRVQLDYRLLRQIHRDFGGTLFNVVSSGDSYSLYQQQTSVEADLANAEQAVLQRFGTIGQVAGVGGVVSYDLGIFAPTIDRRIRTNVI
jgi:hypothetical protein